MFDASFGEGVEDVGDVAAVEVGLVGVDDEGAGYCELFADVAATAGAFGGVAGRGVDAGEADALPAHDLKAKANEASRGISEAHDPLVGTGRIELPTPTVSRRRADPPTPHLLTENGDAEGSHVVKKGPDGGLLTHGVSIARLARDVLSDPAATEREAKLARWVLITLQGGGDG